MKQERSAGLCKGPFAILAVLAFLVAGSLFFWYEYRPGMVREKCSMEAEKRADNDPFVYEIIYRHCLRTHGMEYFEQEEQKERISEQSPSSGPQ